MDVKELRIGNYVNIRLKSSNMRTDYDTITASAIMDLQTNKKTSSFVYEPIPLTEEWLVKFGFEKSWSCDDYDRYEKDDFNMLKDYGSQGVALKTRDKNAHELVLYNHVYCGYYDNEIDCEHVHQLQNLYFALTGKELTLKQTK